MSVVSFIAMTIIVLPPKDDIVPIHVSCFHRSSLNMFSTIWKINRTCRFCPSTVDRKRVQKIAFHDEWWNRKGRIASLLYLSWCCCYSNLDSISKLRKMRFLATIFTKSSFWRQFCIFIKTYLSELIAFKSYAGKSYGAPLQPYSLPFYFPPVFFLLIIIAFGMVVNLYSWLDAYFY